MWVTQCLLLVGVVVAESAASLDLSSPLESDDVIATVNNAKTTWTAGRNFHPSLTKSHAQNLLGAKRHPGGSRLPKYVAGEKVQKKSKHLELPTAFDSRTEWSFCSALQTVRDQGSCGSSWVSSSHRVHAFTDRLCIATNGSWNDQLSVQNMLAYCTGECGMGCYGGYPDFAWTWLRNTGTVTGGDYESLEGCQPYTVAPCEHYVTGSTQNCSSDYDTALSCRSTCTNTNYTTSYADDIHRANFLFDVDDVNDVMKEIYANGPVEATFDVYEDFFSYKSGVYQHTTGDYEGGHAVKIIGWGVEDDGTEYWLVANSWNSDWGDQGFFKILRGSDECSIEDDVAGGRAAI